MSINQAASEVSSDYDDLLDLFERLGNFLKRLDVHINIPPTEMMTDVILKIMVELLSVLVLARKQIKGVESVRVPSNIIPGGSI